MEKTIFDRTERLLGRDALELLKRKRVIIFGLGGVGGHLTEALARAGVGALGVVDFDTVDVTNINRQIIALHSTLGRSKAEVMAERIRDINPLAEVKVFRQKLTADTIESFSLEAWDYIADAIDDVPAKILLIREAKRLETPIICSMGTGNKRDPGRFQVADIEKTHTCPLAKAVRKELRTLGITGVKVVFSAEEPRRTDPEETKIPGPASISFVPPAAGLMLAAGIVEDLIKENR